ncbi:MAG: hypothetical protein RLZZ611_2016 [Cyanobacteriota bacterium]|jgi:hypothetical protein
MSFDARSLERLKQLGRTLPQPLPKPEAAPSPPTAATGERRHRVETETNPEALFRELMQVSPDGTVPPHLMDRLRQAEASERGRRSRQARNAQPAAATGPAAQTRGERSRGRESRGERQLQQRGERRPPVDGATQELYASFQHLLLEDDADD